MIRILFVLVPVAVAALGYWYVPKSEWAFLHPDSRTTIAVPALPPTAGLARPSEAAQGTPLAPAKLAVVAPSRVIAASDAQQKTELTSRVAQAQQAAVAKYPALAVAGSEINSRFVFRYKRLLAEHSSRLQDPAWPTQLADECAAASGIKVPMPATKPRLTAVASN